MSPRAAYPLAILALIAASTSYAAGSAFSGAVLCLLAGVLVLAGHGAWEGRR